MSSRHLPFEPFCSNWWRRAAYLFEERPIAVAVGSMADMFGSLGALNPMAFESLFEGTRWLDEQLISTSAVVTDVRPLLSTLITELHQSRLYGFEKRSLLQLLENGTTPEPRPVTNRSVA